MPTVNVRDQGRVQRLISLAYFLSARNEVHIEELAELLGIDRSQVEADLNVLMYCGLPPYSPEQLFDIIIEDDFVSMYFNDVFIAPMRLNEEERAHVVIALMRLLAQSQDETERKAIEQVAGIIDDSPSHVVVVEAPLAKFDDMLRESISSQTPVEITYLSLSSATISERIIDVRGLYTTGSVTYIFAFNHDVDDYRVFRTDRILDAQLRDDIAPREPGGRVNDAPENEALDEASLYIENKDSFVNLSIDPNASWVLDSFPHEVVDETKHLYKFYTPSSFFVARIILSNQPYIRYISGTFPREAILNALETLHHRMKKTTEG